MASFFRKSKTPSAGKKQPEKPTGPTAAGAGPPKSKAAMATKDKETLVKTEEAVKGVVKSAVKAKGFFSRAPTIVGIHLTSGEADRLKHDKERSHNWKRWGPFLSDRQWATVREDYSADGSWFVYIYI